MTAHIDAIGNVHGVVEGSDSSLGELLVGSHYDTVVDGGKCVRPGGVVGGGHGVIMCVWCNSCDSLGWCAASVLQRTEGTMVLWMSSLERQLGREWYPKPCTLMIV
jgi:hypothetical protein